MPREDDDDQNEGVENDLADAVEEEESDSDSGDDDQDDSSEESEESDDDSDDDEELGERGKRALDRMKRERKQLRAQLAETKKLAKKWEDSQKTEAQRLADNAKDNMTRAEKAEQKLMRLEIAIEKGLTPKQAARLQGDSREDMETDADELLEIFNARNSNGKAAPNGKPKEKLRGGADPEESREETDPKKLASQISRSRF